MIDLDMIDRWNLARYDEAGNSALVLLQRGIDPIKHQAFIAQAKPYLLEQFEPGQEDQVDILIEQMSALEMNIQGAFLVDLETGLVIEGTYKTEQVIQGTVVEIMDLKMSY